MVSGKVLPPWAYPLGPLFLCGSRMARILDHYGAVAGGGAHASLRCPMRWARYASPVLAGRALQSCDRGWVHFADTIRLRFTLCFELGFTFDFTLGFTFGFTLGCTLCFTLCCTLRFTLCSASRYDVALTKSKACAQKRAGATGAHRTAAVSRPLLSKTVRTPTAKDCLGNDEVLTQ